MRRWRSQYPARPRRNPNLKESTKEQSMRPWVQWPARAVLLTASTGAAGASASVAFGGASAATTLSDNQARSPVGSPVSDCESAATVLADPVVGRENVTVGHKDEAQGTSRRAVGMRSSRWSLRPGLPAAIGQIVLPNATAQSGSASHRRTFRPRALASA